MRLTYQYVSTSMLCHICLRDHMHDGSSHGFKSGTPEEVNICNDCYHKVTCTPPFWPVLENYVDQLAPLKDVETALARRRVEAVRKLGVVS